MAQIYPNCLVAAVGLQLIQKGHGSKSPNPAALKPVIAHLQVTQVSVWQFAGSVLKIVLPENISSFHKISFLKEIGGAHTNASQQLVSRQLIQS